MPCIKRKNNLLQIRYTYLWKVQVHAMVRVPLVMMTDEITLASCLSLNKCFRSCLPKYRKIECLFARVPFVSFDSSWVLNLEGGGVVGWLFSLAAPGLIQKALGA